MASPAATGSALSKFIRPGGRLQATDVQAAALWGVAGGTAALYLVQAFVYLGSTQSHYPWYLESEQPFNWLKKTFFEKPEPEDK